MREKQIIKVLKKLGSHEFRVSTRGISTNCPLYWKHKTGTDQKPSLFVFITNPLERESTAYCHACSFKGSLEDLVWDVKRGKKLQGMEVIEYVQRAEMGEVDIEDLGDLIPDYEEVPKFVRRDVKLQNAVNQQRVIQSTWVIPSDGQEISVIEYGNELNIKSADIQRMIIPYLNEVPDYWFERGYDLDTAKLWSIGLQKNFYYRKIKGIKAYYVDFGPRLLITIKDFKGNFVGWSARTLEGCEQPLKTYKHQSGLPIYRTIGSPKYLHCPGFKRNDYLYGEHLINFKNKTAILCEGFTDAINLRRHGYENALAVMGTAIGASQIDKLKKWFDILILFFDGDMAGEKATAKAREQLHGQFKIHIPDRSLFKDRDPGDLNELELQDIFSNIL